MEQLVLRGTRPSQGDRTINRPRVFPSRGERNQEAVSRLDWARVETGRNPGSGGWSRDFVGGARDLRDRAGNSGRGGSMKLVLSVSAIGKARKAARHRSLRG